MELCTLPLHAVVCNAGKRRHCNDTLLPQDYCSDAFHRPAADSEDAGEVSVDMHGNITGLELATTVQLANASAAGK